MVLLIGAVGFSRPASAAEGEAWLPPTLAQLQALQARIDYEATRIDRGSRQPVRGTLIVSGSAWAVDETAPTSHFRADEAGGSLDGAAGSLAVDDPLDADALANPWAVVMGRLHAEKVLASPGSSRVFTTSGQLRVYLDSAMDRIVGVDEAAPDLSFVFDDWVVVDGVELPRSVVRLRGGVTDGMYRISDYRVGAVAPESAPNLSAPANAVAEPSTAEPSLAALHPLATADTSAAWSRFAGACELLFLAVLCVAWLRRDAFIASACSRLARDPRAFKTVGTSVFVSPEGILFFDGCSYRVGAEYYGLPALVQTSALFLRVSVKDSSRALVVPRKFRPIHRFGPLRRPARALGFSLIEVLVAVALFSLVIVGGVYPTLISISRAHAFAEERSRTIRIAANALTDQEAALAYGTASVEGAETSTIDGMQVLTSVSQSDIAGASQISVIVDAEDGRELARVSTTVGPPVPAPRSQTTHEATR